MSSEDVILSKSEKGPLDRFKNQNLLLKKFGDDGLRVYNLIDGVKSASQLLEASELAEDKFVSILEYMEEEAMISVSAESAPEPSQKAPAREQVSRQTSPAPRQKPASFQRNEEEEGQDLIKPIGLDEEEEKPAKTAYTSRQSEEDQESSAQQEPAEEEEAEKQEEEQQEEKPTPKPSPKRKQAEEGEEDEERSKGVLRPKQTREEEEEKIEKEASEEQETFEKPQPLAPPKLEKEQEAPVRPQDQYIQKLAFEEDTGPKISQKEMEELAKLSPIEKIIFNKFGKTGVLVYNLIDGEKTAEEIMLETGLSEMKLVEILEFMETQGIIKLEKPSGEEPPSSAPANSDSQPLPQGPAGSPDEPPKPPSDDKGDDDTWFKPIVEDEGAPESIKDSTGSLSEFADIVPIDVPIAAPTNPVSHAGLKAQLMLKFKNDGPSVLDLVDGKRDTIAISLATRLSLEQVDSILGFLGLHKSVFFKPLGREEIRQRYGEDGLSIYKKYGREGVLLYELIGKEPSLRDIILRSRVEPHRAIEIVIFIHTLLGIDIPLSKEVLYKQLGINPA